MTLRRCLIRALHTSRERCVGGDNPDDCSDERYLKEIAAIAHYTGASANGGVRRETHQAMRRDDQHWLRNTQPPRCGDGLSARIGLVKPPNPETMI